MTMASRVYKGVRICLFLSILLVLGICFKHFVTKLTFSDHGISRNLNSESGPYFTNSPSEHVSKKRARLNAKCVQPELELWPPGFKRVAQTSTPPHCSKEKNWIYTAKGSMFISKSAQETHGKIVCQGRPIERSDGDYVVMYGDRIKPFSDRTLLTSDSVEVECVAQDGANYNNIHAGIRQDPKLKGSRNADDGNSTPFRLNIFIFAFDSVSRMMWMRDLPQTYKYLVAVLGASVLEGYNIVGDGTSAAMFPILTGQADSESPETTWGHANQTTVDGLPWIWKELKKVGYVTQYGEDMSQIGTFHLTRTGFKFQPTDHYMRPFYLKAEERYTNESAFCLGSLRRLQVLQSWGKEFYKTYPDQLKFSLLFHNEYSHDHIDRLNWADEDVVELLDFLNTEGHLDDTLLIVMSDHGQRMHPIRQTLQGKYEERMPFFSIRLPPSFQKQHPDVMKNVRVNTQRLTTPFDIHATLRDVAVKFTGAGVGDTRNRGISLFKEVPRTRTCGEAEIKPHYCTCLNWADVDTNDALVQRAASYVVAFINNVTMEYREQCAVLSLLNISSAAQFSESTDTTNRRTMVSNQLYQVTLVTKPNFAIYEATVKFLVSQNSFVGNTEEISRINRYYNQADCALKEKPHLRLFCYCHKQQSDLNE